MVFITNDSDMPQRVIDKFSQNILNHDEQMNTIPDQIGNNTKQIQAIESTEFLQNKLGVPKELALKESADFSPSPEQIAQQAAL